MDPDRPPYLRSVSVGSSPDYAQEIPAIAGLGSIGFGRVTFLVGANGSGKSTLIEALAVVCGYNPEGGGRNLRFETQRTHSDLWRAMVPSFARRSQWGWFLRAETFYGLATYVANDDERFGVKRYFPDLHALSHGESFLALIEQKFDGQGLYLMDEPESALSFEGQLRLLRFIHEGVSSGAQFIIATHSPVLMRYPGAWIYELDADGIHRRDWDDLAVVGLWRRFLNAPERILDQLLTDP